MVTFQITLSQRSSKHTLQDLKKFCAFERHFILTTFFSLRNNDLGNISKKAQDHLYTNPNQSDWGMSSGIGGKKPMRKYGYELKWAVSDAHAIWFFLLLPGCIDVHQKSLKLDVNIFSAVPLCLFYIRETKLFSLPRYLLKKVKGKGYN